MKPLSPVCITGNADRERRSNRGGAFASPPSSDDPRPGVRPGRGSTSCRGVPGRRSVIKHGTLLRLWWDVSSEHVVFPGRRPR